MNKTLFLRKDLNVIRTVNQQGKVSYLVEKPLTDEVFTMGEEEMFLGELLCETDDLHQIASRFKERFGQTVSVDHIQAFRNRLRDQDLLEGAPPPPPSKWQALEYQTPETWTRWKIFNPGKLLVRLERIFGFCYSRTFVYFCLALFILAAMTAIMNFSQFLLDARRLVGPYNFIQIMAFMYIGISIPGELARGLSSVRFGGRCDESGIWMAYNIMPRFYCLTNVWEIPGKSRRSWTLFSPSFYAILAGSMGILLWKLSPAVSTLQKYGLTLACVALFDSFIRLFVLWPNEAHFILSNHLEQEQFRSRAVKTFKAWLFRRPAPEPLTGRERRIFITYGLLTTCFTFPCLAIAIYYGAKMLIGSFAGTGGLLVVGILTVKYRKIISGFARETTMVQWLKDLHGRFSKKTRLAFWVILVIIILLFPYPYDTSGPFKILAVERTELHALVSGEIKKVLVKENDIVQQGSPQAVIDNYEHKKNLDAAQADLDKERENLRMMENGPKPEDVKKAEDEVERARTQSIYSRKEEVRLQYLHKEGVVALEEYEKAAQTADVDERTLAVAKSNLAVVKSWPRPEEKEAQKALVRQREAQVKFYAENMRHTELTAPIAGRVITPNVELKTGQYLKAGDLFAIYENSAEARVEVQLPEADLFQIEKGGKVRFKLQAYPTHTFEGTVVMIAPIAEELPTGRVVRVLLKVPNEKNELKAEMSGAAKIEGGWKPLVVAFTRPVVRFVMVEIWSWIP